jgi:hypothetical protein
MKQILRVLVSVTGAIVVAALITLGAMVQSSRSKLERTYQVAGVELTLPTDAASLEDGHRMYRAYGCVSCHLEDGGGRIVIPNGLGFIAAPDITVSSSAMPVADLERIVRDGVRPSGAPMLLMPSHDYWYFDDESTARILAYTRTLPVAGRGYGANSLSMVGHVVHALDAMPIVPAEHITHGARRPPMGAPGTVELGRTLGRLCTGCHGEHLSGGPIPGTDPAQLGTPANLTPDGSGLGGWSEEQFVAAMRTGARPNGTQLNNTWMPWEEALRYMTDDELHSLWLFLREQPPLPFGGR